MKNFAIVLALCLVAGAHSVNLSEEHKAKLREYEDICLSENGLDRSFIEDIIKGGAVPVDDKVDCFASCMLKKVGVLRADDTFDMDEAIAKAAIANVDVSKANEIIGKCKDLKGKDSCETAGLLFRCFMENHTIDILD